MLGCKRHCPVIFQSGRTNGDCCQHRLGAPLDSHPPGRSVHFSAHLSHSGGCAAVPFSASTCISLVTNDVKHISLCLLAIWASSLMKCLFRSFANFVIRLSVFSLSIYRCSVDVLDSRPSLDTCIANIFFNLTWCLAFLLLPMSFDGQSFFCLNIVLITNFFSLCG